MTVPPAAPAARSLERDDAPRVAADAPIDSLPVVELFHSIQGEGIRVGEPATFIRLAGCNLRCSWCDTPYSWNREGLRSARRTPIDELAASARERAVVITGGEPMLHHRKLGALIDELRAHGTDRHVTVETNATIAAPDLMGAVDLWSLSPKLPGSGEPFPTDSVGEILDLAHASTASRERTSERAGVQLKFVIVDLAADWAAMWQHLDELGIGLPTSPGSRRDVPVLVQPDGYRDDYDAAIRELVELVAADDTLRAGVPRRSLVRVVPQIHRVAWGPAARGV